MEGLEEGMEKAMEKGELIGEIRLTQYQLELPLNSKEELAQQTLEALQPLYHDLQRTLPQHPDRETPA